MELNVLSRCVMTQIEKTFDEEGSVAVKNALEKADYPLIGPNRERVELALIHLSSGNLNRFSDLLTEAKKDWRDTLLGANLGYDNWLDVLQARGIHLDRS